MITSSFTRERNALLVKAENHRGICFNPLPLSQEKEIAAAKVQIYELEKALLAFLDIRIANRS
ncbi:hypothetical protein [Leptospira interrogans]|uniref:hypothetical protein n=1 Tax=Leptospira interrogans TaxID=173 RepID=UPI0002BBFF74|nr:hypothetical protein [Leptospira interrogans]MCR8649236.1 hypothetical protein [Leptospira interrogans serovar Bataviae]OAM85833.1 hypothetical protein A1343_02580 [Leptospira interrogans serovar Bataviae]QOI37769.1 hypothetical protein Lepto1548_05385 [Leptospira interrogans serovar Bataviae]QYY61348.1 hypothetical protein GR153_005010 [Leptospira interrogans serovar Bataviae]